MIIQIAKERGLGCEKFCLRTRKKSVSESLVLTKVKVKSLKLVSQVSATGKSKTTKREIINLTSQCPLV